MSSVFGTIPMTSILQYEVRRTIYSGKTLFIYFIYIEIITQLENPRPLFQAALWNKDDKADRFTIADHRIKADFYSNRILNKYMRVCQYSILYIVDASICLSVLRYVFEWVVHFHFPFPIFCLSRNVKALTFVNWCVNLHLLSIDCDMNRPWVCMCVYIKAI